MVNGKANWALHLDPKGKILWSADSNPLWEALGNAGGARVTNLSPLAQSDNLLFCRALANFLPPMRIAAKKNANFAGYGGTVTNDGEATVPQAWLLYLHAGGGLMQPLHSVPGQGGQPFSPTPKEMPSDYFLKIQSRLGFELEQAGLTEGEAPALTASFTHN